MTSPASFSKIFSSQAWQALPLGSRAIHEALREDLTIRGTVKIGDATEYKKVSDLGIQIPDDVIEDVKVQQKIIFNVKPITGCW